MQQKKRSQSVFYGENSLFLKIRRFFIMVHYKSYCDLISESKRTYLSFGWWILEPLALMVIYYLVFKYFLSIRTENFAFYILVSLTFWQWFHKSVNCGLNTINLSGPVIAKIKINKLFFPTVAIYTDLIKSFLAIGVLLVIVNVLVSPLSWYYAWLPILIAIQLLLIIAVTYFFSLIVPFFPDIRPLIDLFLRGLMFASAIFYPIDSLPESVRSYLYYNPIAYLLDCYRKILIYHEAMPQGSVYYLANLALVSISLIFFSIWIEKKMGILYVKLLMK